MGRLALLTLLFMVAGTGHATVTRTRTSQAQRPAQNHPYRRHWKHATFGKRAIAGSAAGAGLRSLQRHPRQGTGAAGFARGFGSGFATHGVQMTVEHAIAAPLHEDLHYHRSTKRGFGPRLKHALVSTVVTRNTRTGKRTPAVGRLSGHAAAGVVSQTLLPAAGGAATAGIGIGVEAGANVAREFWPRRKTATARR